MFASPFSNGRHAEGRQGAVPSHDLRERVSVHEYGAVVVMRLLAKLLYRYSNTPTQVLFRLRSELFPIVLGG